MKTLYILIVFFGLVLVLEATNQNKKVYTDSENKLNTFIFSNIYKHKFDSL